MLTSEAHSILSRAFPHGVERLGISRLEKRGLVSIESLSEAICNLVPVLDYQSIHGLTQIQERNVLHTVTGLRDMDLYDEMSSVCSSLQDLNKMSHEEVLNHISNLKYEFGSESESEAGESVDNNMVHYHHNLDEHNEILSVALSIHCDHHETGKGLDSIFDEFDHHHSWVSFTASKSI